ncbi:formin-like protein 18 isoform X3 [Vulpes lagopus]|uniref:formin-like protein 18 isoform X3 n=1 Tax=Vulpes lagopus TaxID=494514 RepID=UPI001BC9DCAC|nr:formin-like protein 18 isoform X3 [Vulpes lagopus]
MKWKWGGTEACEIRQFVKATEPKQTRIPKTQLAGAGEGCALARAPVRSAISWALFGATGPPGPAPRPLSANRSAPGRPAGPGTRGGEGTALHPRPAALPARRTCSRRLPPPPPAEPGRGGGGGGRAPAGTAAASSCSTAARQRSPDLKPEQLA